MFSLGGWMRSRGAGFIAQETQGEIRQHKNEGKKKEKRKGKEKGKVKKKGKEDMKTKGKGKEHEKSFHFLVFDKWR